MDGQIIEDKIYEITFQFDRGDAYENAVNPWIETSFVCGRHVLVEGLENDEDVNEIAPTNHPENCVFCDLEDDAR